MRVAKVVASKFQHWLTIVGACISIVGCSPQRPPSAPHPLLGQRVEITWRSNPEVNGPPTAGHHRMMLMEFWSPTCSPCRPRLLELVHRKSQLSSMGVNLRLVAVLDDDESTDSAQRILNELGIREPFGEVSTDAAINRLATSVLPATWLLDANGRLLWVAPASARQLDIERAARMYAEPSAP
jgi:hypothetical protein